MADPPGSFLPDELAHAVLAQQDRLAFCGRGSSSGARQKRDAKKDGAQTCTVACVLQMHAGVLLPDPAPPLFRSGVRCHPLPARQQRRTAAPEEKRLPTRSPSQANTL